MSHLDPFTPFASLVSPFGDGRKKAGPTLSVLGFLVILFWFSGCRSPVGVVLVLLLLGGLGAAGYYYKDQLLALIDTNAGTGEEPRPGAAQRIELRVRTDQGLVAQHSASLAGEAAHLVLALPEDADYGLYEIEWNFDYAECERPSACFSARLLEARLEGAPPGAG